jgi:type I restriction enzyme, S subunit
MSGANENPAQWRKRRLRFDAYLNPLKSRLDLSADAEVSFVPMDAVGELGGLALNETRSIEEVYNGYTYFADGDVVIAKITPCFENGKGALAEGLTNGVAFGTTELHVIRPLPGLDARFLFYLTVAHDFRSFGEAEMLGAGGQKRVPEEFLKDWRAPLPPLETQQRIARFLDEKTARIDGLIEKKRALLDRLAEKRQALITRAVTKGLNPDADMKPSGIDWLGEIPAHWEVKQLRRVRRYMTSGSRDWAAYYADEGDPFLRMTNVTGQGVELYLDDLRFVCLEGVTEGTRTSVLEGDILITITAELGSVAIVRKDIEGAYINQHLALFRPNAALCSSDFLVNFLSTDMARAQFMVSGQGGTKQGLGFEQVNNVILGSPPRDEQEAIAAFCAGHWRKFEAAERLLSSTIDRLAEYRSALVTAAVTGQVADLA